MKQVILRQLVKNDENAFYEGLKDWRSEDISWYTFDWKPGFSFDSLLEILNNNTQGINIPEQFVPSTMLYGFVDNNIIGRIHIRHKLSDKLMAHGGHLGYAVSEKYRKKGYASEMMKQSLVICKHLGLDKLLLTCDDKNIPSIKIIEKFGGKLEKIEYNEQDNRLTRRYWLENT